MVVIFREISFCLSFLLFHGLGFLLTSMVIDPIDYQGAAISTCQLIKKDHVQKAAITREIHVTHHETLFLFHPVKVAQLL